MRQKCVCAQVELHVKTENGVFPHIIGFHTCRMLYSMSATTNISALFLGTSELIRPTFTALNELVATPLTPWTFINTAVIHSLLWAIKRNRKGKSKANSEYWASNTYNPVTSPNFIEQYTESWPVAVTRILPRVVLIPLHTLQRTTPGRRSQSNARLLPWNSPVSGSMMSWLDQVEIKLSSLVNPLVLSFIHIFQWKRVEYAYVNWSTSGRPRLDLIVD